MILDETGGCVERLDYAPFGGQISRGYDCYGGASNEKPLFTGQLRDGESTAGTDTGQDYFNARYLWANIARFTSADAPVRTGTVLTGVGVSARELVSKALTEFTLRGYLFTGSAINQNRYLRLGYSRKGADRVFRVGGQILEKATGRKKIDIFKWGRL